MSKPTPLTPEQLTSCLETEADRIGTVKVKLLLYLPFWASILMQTRLVPQVTLDTYGATDCVDVIYYNPLLTRSLSLKQLTFLTIHECGHIVYEHGIRRNGRAHKKWNHATDYVVNLMALDVKSEQLGGRSAPVGEFIKGGLLDEQFRNACAEEVYDRIPNPKDDQFGCDNNFGGSIDSHLPPPTDPHVQDRILEKILKAHAQWEAAGQRGDIPSGVVRRVEQLRNSAVPWQRTLRQFAVQCLSHDEMSYAPPHRRRLIRDELCLPSLKGERYGSLAVFVDTSGSIDQEELTQALSELTALSDLADDLLFLSHDCAVQDVIPTHHIPAFVASLKTGTGGAKGGGGTSHRPPFQWVADQGVQPDLVIAFTDLDTDFPDQAPPYPVLWCVWPKDANKPVPFGKVVVIHPPTD